MDFVVNNLLLITVAVVSGAMLVWPLVRGRFAGVPEVDTLEAVQLINQRDALLLDVREDSEYETLHIPNSKHIPAARVGERLKELEKFKNKPVLVLCRSGNRSTAACGLLKEQGFADVRSLKGGIEAWQQANLPVRKK
ncbi:MAG TPA: rhodanese-like domain-containing protein [Burkholderiales bacterium]